LHGRAKCGGHDAVQPTSEKLKHGEDQSAHKRYWPRKKARSVHQRGRKNFCSFAEKHFFQRPKQDSQKEKLAATHEN
jgi:hypothetical protein